ncbi:MAG: hypothetical protein KDE56_15640 [Anaerolineales bacterium]|nr:hypothetical protein [Anaerolineales bacterium]
MGFQPETQDDGRGIWLEESCGLLAHTVKERRKILRFYTLPENRNLESNFADRRVAAGFKRGKFNEKREFFALVAEIRRIY